MDLDKQNQKDPQDQMARDKDIPMNRSLDGPAANVPGQPNNLGPNKSKKKKKKVEEDVIQLDGDQNEMQNHNDIVVGIPVQE